MDKKVHMIDIRNIDPSKLQVLARAYSAEVEEGFLDAIQENGYGINDFSHNQLRQILKAAKDCRNINYAHPYVSVGMMKYFRKMSPKTYSTSQEVADIPRLAEIYSKFKPKFLDDHSYADFMWTEASYHLLRNYGYDYSKMTAGQMKEIRLGYEKGIDLPDCYVDHTYSRNKIKNIRKILELMPDVDIRFSKYTESQLGEIFECLRRDIPLERFADPGNSAMVMQFIRMGIIYKSPYEQYLNKGFSDEQLAVIMGVLANNYTMRDTQNSLVDVIAKKVLSACEMVDLYNKLASEKYGNNDGGYLTYKVKIATVSRKPIVRGG